MTEIDKAILDTDINICKNISKFNDSDRGLLSQNILSQLRNFVEYIAMRLCSNGKDVDPNDYGERVRLLEALKTRGDLRFLYKFHNLLQKSASHYTLDENASERLMLKYYEYLLKVKTYLSQKCNLQVLKNIKDFPIDTDNDVNEYHQKIAERIDNSSLFAEKMNYNERFYIQKIKPFYVNEKVYYEVTFTIATDNVSKFDRVIAFTSLDILENYAVKFSIHKDVINISNSKMKILIIDSWQASIRPCELNNFGYIFMGKLEIKSNNLVYDGLMRFISESNMNLLDFLDSDDDFYNTIKNQITQRAKNTALFGIFDTCREIIKNNKAGANILRYLLYTMNNTILNAQIDRKGACDILSDLHLKRGCKPFDTMPFVMSLVNHNPQIFDLLECISAQEREYEFFARYIKTNTEQKGALFTKAEELANFQNLDDLIKLYESRLYYKHLESRSIKKFSNLVYINGYVEDCLYIIRRLKDIAFSGVKGYQAYAESWLQEKSDKIDDKIKRDVLRQMFVNSRVAFIYGSAGTGKSTLIKHVSELFALQSKLYLANTNSAVENLRRKVAVSNCDYMTVARFLSPKNSKTEYDMVFIDESSTLCNSDMREVLEKAQFKLLILVGDIYQIEAIQFGNWFSIAKQFIPKTSIFELKDTFRSTDKDLRNVWSKVRNLEEDMKEAIVKFGYSKRLDNSIFKKACNDEIILCLNYDGLYGINNVNSFLQDNNSGKSVVHGVHTYKIGDPVLFNKSNRLGPAIYNNLKGIIRNIEEAEKAIFFDIEIDTVLSEFDTSGYSFDFLGNSENGKSVIRFSADRRINTDYDDAKDEMPFQIAYAVSIHKAQGLEYDSVKIIISDEIEERITYNIFYTAITRARKKLSIYWSPEVEARVLSNLKRKTNAKCDAEILKSLYPSLKE